MVAKRKSKVLGKSVATQKVGDPLEVSQSTIKCWRRCHAQYDYRYVQLIRRKKPIVYFVEGRMIGECLDAIALKRIQPKAPHWKTALDPYIKAYSKLFADEKEYYGDPIGEAERIVSRYEQLYANDGLTYLMPPKSIKWILPYELPVRVDFAPGIVFTGNIDKMPQDKQGRVWDLDHKAYKKIPDTDDRFKDLQQVFYQWAMPLSGYPTPTGVIWDYLRKKAPVVPDSLVKGGLSQRQSMDTTWEIYLAEINRLGLNAKDYTKMREILEPRGTMDFFQRVQLPSPSKPLVKNVVDEARWTAIEIKRSGGVDKVRTIDRTCKSCEFYTLCSAEFRGLDASFIRKSEYEINPEPRHVHVMDTDE